jgi:GABA(A) receptor-associated protein
MSNKYFVKNKSIEDLLKKHPSQIPIILTKHPGSDVTELLKKKYLVTKDITLSQFTYFLRKLIKLKPSEAIFIFTNKTLLTGQTKMEDIYEKYKNEDSVLYITYSAENAFG